MSQVVRTVFEGRGPDDVPRLFTQTREFRFHGGIGRLLHRRTPPGPRGFVLVESVSTGHETRFVERERSSLTMPLSGTLEVRVEGRRFVTGPGGLIAIGPSERRSDHVPRDGSARFASYTIIAPAGGPDPRRPDGWLHRPNCRTQEQLCHVIRFVFRLLESTPEISPRGLSFAEALVEDVFHDALAMPESEPATGTATRWYEWLVREAETVMQACYNQPLSMPEVAQAVGVGVRTLQSAFQARKGVTPRQCLTEVRLRAIRAKLVRPDADTTVTTAAMDSGIFHFGRCIAAYRRQFGETPGSTLRRARSGATAGRATSP